MLSAVAQGKMKMTVKERRVAWPPRIIHQTPMGVHRDGTGNKYPRDIGRSSMLSNGDIIFQFGDTFMHNEKGTFIGLASNTYSVATDTTNPSLSLYNHASPVGQSPIEPFIPLEPGEIAQGLKACSFSGIVEDVYDREIDKREGYKMKLIQGWTFFEIRRTIPNSSLLPYHQYVGVAKVVYNPDEKEATATWTGASSANRILFAGNEPRFGSLCVVLADDDHIYLYGQRSESDKDICVARVHANRANLRQHYEFFDGKEWNKDIRNAASVMRNMQQGQVFRSKMFGATEIYEWVFIGVNAQGDSKVQMGRAKNPEGPWDIQVTEIHLHFTNPVLFGQYAYCVYPHPWADETHENGDLTISWCESIMDGHVLMSKIRFQMEDVKV
ncbi:hypothetical protein BKA65DRAFT_590568 [Rhexocercosporidium sp. MPI-PUGE-AT-0058]|nr:hypothetical protein BKA65DRAFT_590568 [Rhexocercosporidium sp. MPI-PUGE-AT-0058]